MSDASDVQNWHYIDGPRRVGPFDDLEWAELVRAGTVQGATLVWNEHLPAWARYETVRERFPLPLLEGSEEKEGEQEEDGAPLSPPPLPGERGRAVFGEARDAKPARLYSPEIPGEEYEAELLGRDYRADSAACLRSAFDLYRQHAVTLAGTTMLTWLLLSIGASLGAGLFIIMPLALNGVLLGGLYSVYLKLMRGEPAGVTDVFSGFRRGIFANLAIRTLVGTLVSYACVFLGVLVLRVAGLDLTGVSDPEQLVGMMERFFKSLDGLTLVAIGLLLAVCMLPSLLLAVCWIFSIPLIRDRRVPWRIAMRLSRRKVMQHPFGVAGVLVRAGLVAAALPVGLGLAVGLVYPAGAPLVVMLLGVFFGLPLFIGALMALYERVFGEMGEVEEVDGKIGSVGKRDESTGGEGPL